MKLLPKKELAGKINDQKKADIDSGVFIARKVDALREELLLLQKERNDFIAGSQTVINDSLAPLQKKYNLLIKEIKELEEQRKELLKPLDHEWEKVTKLKEEVLEGKESLNLLRGNITQESIVLEKEKANITKITTQLEIRQEEIEKLKSETLELNELAKKEYEVASEEHISQTTIHQKEISKLAKLIKEYETGITTNKIKEEENERKEADIIKREQHLESRQKQLRIAYEVIKNAT